MDDLIEKVLAEITTCLHLVPGDSLNQAVTMIEDAPKIFVSGAGRSGLMMRALATRLMHLGKTVHVVGEPTTPSIQPGELLILGSGSGQTSTLLAIAQKAKARVQKSCYLLPIHPRHWPTGLTNTVTLPAPSLGDIEEDSDLKSIQPMGTLFEQSLLIVCDIITLLVNGADRCQRFSNACAPCQSGIRKNSLQ